MNQRKFLPILVLSIIMTSIVQQSMAICTYSSMYITYTNKRICSWGCGFLGIYKQNVWDEETSYRCINGPQEKFIRYNVRNGNCC